MNHFMAQCVADGIFAELSVARNRRKAVLPPIFHSREDSAGIGHRNVAQ